MSKLTFCSKFIVAAALLGGADAYGQWRQWGGQDRSFIVEKADLDLDWSGENEPNLLWEKQLGAGGGSVLIDRARGFVHHREGQEEVILALDLISGETLWRANYASPIPEGYPAPQALGPQATPVINITRLFTLGSLGHIHSFDVANGSIFWSFDAPKEFNLKAPQSGYAAPPHIFKDRIIFFLGSEAENTDTGIVVFHQPTGKLLWRQQSLPPLAAPPVIVEMGGREVLILPTGNQLLGLNPYMGQELWRIEHDRPFTPRWCENRSTLFIPSASPAGSAAYSIKADGPKDVVKPLWKKPELQVEQSVLVSDQIYAAGAIDGKPSVFRIGVDTGELVWKDESFGRGYVIYADDKLLILDRQGNLAIGTDSGGSLVVHTRTKIEPKGQWAAPSLDMGRLYLRDHARVLAFNLNATQYPAETGKKDKRAPKVEKESK